MVCLTILGLNKTPIMYAKFHPGRSHHHTQYRCASLSVSPARGASYASPQRYPS